MSVSVTLQLPAQPAVGVVQLVPLGGDGYSAPKAMFTVNSLTAVSDASGGLTSIQLLMDQNYSSLVAFMSMTVLQALAADVQVQMRVRTPGTFPDRVAIQFDRGVVSEMSDVSTTQIARTWSPQPIILGGSGSGSQIDVTIENIDTDILTLSAAIYLFDNTVRTRAPMGPLLWARGAT